MDRQGGTTGRECTVLESSYHYYTFETLEGYLEKGNYTINFTLKAEDLFFYLPISTMKCLKLAR